MGRRAGRLIRAALGVSLAVVMTLAFSATAFASTQADVTSSKGWKQAYERCIKYPKTSLGKLSDISYEKSYFGKEYKITKYFLYDTNRDGIPELFLVLPKTFNGRSAMCYVLTYHNGKVRFVEFTNLIGAKNGYLLEKGHWHGSGGCGYEWHGVKISYVDGYTVRTFDTEKTSPDSKKIYVATGRARYGKSYKSRTLSEKRLTYSQYKRFYNKRVKGYTKFASRFRNASSVKDSGAIERY